MLEKAKKLNVPTTKECVQLRIALVGDVQTGKSSFLRRYVMGSFPAHYDPTLGVECADKHLQVRNEKVHVTFWDFSGKLDFLELRNEFYKEAQAILVFIDLANKASLDSVDYWIKEVRDNGGTCPIWFASNKTDCRKLTPDLSKEAKKCEGGCREISAKTGEGVEELMKELLEAVL